MIRASTFNPINLFDRFNFHATITERPRVCTGHRWRLGEPRDGLPPPKPPVRLGEEGAPRILATTPVQSELGPMGQLVEAEPAAHMEALLLRTDQLNADIQAVQEVGNIAAPREHNALLAAPCPYLVLIEGKDPRFINVRALSRLPIASATSHR